jgi:16S rRNA (cytidine1402-2'-O)-methyltransferase
LTEFGISKPLLTCRDDNEKYLLRNILDILHRGENVCLISDGGTFRAGDPGFRLVRTCRKQGPEVEAVPGPCAAIAALSLSGLPTDRFLLVGFFPQKAHGAIGPERVVCVAKELRKIHGRIFVRKTPVKGESVAIITPDEFVLWILLASGWTVYQLGLQYGRRS